MESLLSNPIFWIIAVICLIIFIYNNLNSSKRRVEKSFATIDVYLQQRTTMIKTLLEVAIVSMDKETENYKQCARLRSGAENYNSSSINEKIEFSNAVRGVMGTFENYPSVRSTEAFLNVQTNMVSEEKQIGAARRAYNNNATDYNTKITSFPIGVFAKIFGFKEEFELFKIDAEKRESMTNGDDFDLGAITDTRKNYQKKDEQ